MIAPLVDCTSRAGAHLAGYPSGQRDLTVNQTALHSGVRIPHPPPREGLRDAGPFARVVEEVIRTRHLDHAEALEAINAIGRTELAILERGLTVLEIVAGVSPLLGLLGTVLGMVTVFDAITTEGIGDPQVLSGGISKALVTTVVGLLVAIPALAFHSWFSRRVDDLGAEIHHLAMQFMFRVRQA